MTVDPLLNLTEEVEARRQRVSLQLEQSRRIELGQFFTPSPIAAFLTSLFDLRDRPSSLLDPGAGVGSLTAAFVARWGAECNSPLSVTACEVDSCLHDDLSATLASCQQIPSVRRADLLGANFIEWSAASLGGLRIGDASLFTYVVMNPPYRKLANGSHVRNLLRSVGLDAPNLYAAFRPDTRTRWPAGRDHAAVVREWTVFPVLPPRSAVLGLASPDSRL